MPYMFGIYDMTVFLLLCFQNQRLGTLVSLSISGENPSGQTLIGRLFQKNYKSGDTKSKNKFKCHITLPKVVL